MDPTFDAIANLFKTNPWIGLLIVAVGIIWKYGPNIAQWFKEFMIAKNDKVDKMINSLERQNDKFFSLFETQGRIIENITDKMTTAIDKVGDAITSIEKSIISSEARVIDKITQVETKLSDRVSQTEINLKDEITEIKIESITQYVEKKSSQQSSPDLKQKDVPGPSKPRAGLSDLKEIKDRHDRSSA